MSLLTLPLALHLLNYFNCWKPLRGWYQELHACAAVSWMTRSVTVESHAQSINQQYNVARQTHIFTGVFFVDENESYVLLN